MYTTAKIAFAGNVAQAEVTQRVVWMTDLTCDTR